MTTLELQSKDYENTYLFKKLIGNEKVLAITKLSKIEIYSFIVITICTCGLATPFLIRSLFDYKFSEFILTENRLAIKKGIINNNVYEILIPKIEAVNIYQNLIGKIFNYGTKLFHSTIIFTAKNPSELNNEAIQPHRSKIIDINFKSPSEEIQDIEASKPEKIKKLKNIEFVKKNPREAINNFIEIFASDEVKPLEKDFGAYQVKRAEAVFENMPEMFKKPENKGLRDILDIGFNVLRKA